MRSMRGLAALRAPQLRRGLATTSKKIAVLPGDGIGPEVRRRALHSRHARPHGAHDMCDETQVMTEALKVLQRTSEVFPECQFACEEAPIGGAVIWTP